MEDIHSTFWAPKSLRSVKKLVYKEMKIAAGASNPSQGAMWVDVYKEISYASHAMPPKPDYPKTKPKSKTNTQDPMVVIDTFEDVIEPDLHK